MQKKCLPPQHRQLLARPRRVAQQNAQAHWKKQYEEESTTKAIMKKKNKESFREKKSITRTHHASTHTPHSVLMRHHGECSLQCGANTLMRRWRQQKEIQREVEEHLCVRFVTRKCELLLSMQQKKKKIKIRFDELLSSEKKRSNLSSLPFSGIKWNVNKLQRLQKKSSFQFMLTML